MPALKARIGGAWVNVGGADEVFVGASAPTDPNSELWYDTSVITVAGSGLYGSGTMALRPTAPAQPGFQYYATDTQRLWIWNGSAWLLIGGKMPRVHCTRTVAYSLANGANTGLPWNNEDVDTDVFHDNATNPDRITIPAGLGGRYRVDAVVGVDANATGTRAAWLEVGAFGGTRFSQAECPVNSATYGASLVISREFAFVAGDWVRVVGYQASGVALNMPNSITSSHFAAQYMGPS